MKKIAALILLLVLIPVSANAVTVTWWPNNEEDVDHYNIYQNGAFMAEVPHNLDALIQHVDCHTGEVRPCFTWTDLTPKKCADSWQVKAVDKCGMESDLSDPGVWCPPGKVKGVQVSK